MLFLFTRTYTSNHLDTLSADIKKDNSNEANVILKCVTGLEYSLMNIAC